MMLKQASFTFSVPKTAGSQPTSSFMPDPAAAMATDNLDWGSLTTFDPSVLSLLDDSPSQPTATDGASQLDFGFGSPGAFTTIASNPSFMSFASAFDDPPSEHPSAGTPPFSFDSSPPNSWGQSPSTSDPNAVEDLFNSCGPINFQALISDTPSINNRNSVSPILHRSSPSTSSSGQSSTLNTPKDSSSVSNACSGGADCPKTKEQIREHVAQQGLSVFAPSPNLTIKETGDSVFGPTIMCKGSSFPKTAKSDSNVPVLSAWRTITSNPEFKV
jgi:AP-1-like factor